MFHVERFSKIKTLFNKGFLVFIAATLFTCCIQPRHTIEINDYVLVSGGKKVLGREQGLTAFIFENNPRKMPFVQFAADKYGVGSYKDVNYWVTYEGHKLKVLLYDLDELQKYFDMGQFMVTSHTTDVNVIGSKEHFIGLSVINESNEDCLDDSSLFKQVTLKYLKELKDEYNNL